MRTIDELAKASENLTAHFNQMERQVWRAESVQLAMELFPLLKDLPAVYGVGWGAVIARSMAFYSKEQQLQACAFLWQKVLESTDSRVQNSYSSIIEASRPGLNLEDLKKLLPLTTLDLARPYPMAMAAVIRALKRTYSY